MRETTRLLCEHIIEPIALLIESFIMRQSNEEDCYQIYQTVAAGHWELSMKYMNTRDANDGGIYAACVEGSMDLVHAFINAGATNFDSALNGALCVKNINYELTTLLISREANPCDYSHMNIVAKNGNIEACRYLLDHGSDKYDEMLCGGCRSGRMDIIQLAISCGANNYTNGLYYAAARGNLGLCVLMIHLGGQVRLDTGLYGACLGGHIRIARMMIARGATDVYRGLGYACQERHQNLIKYMIQCGATRCPCYRPLADH